MYPQQLNALLAECCHLCNILSLWAEGFAAGRYCRAHSYAKAARVQVKGGAVRVNCFVQDVCFHYMEGFRSKL